jgi:hypothetical protein
MFDIDINNVFVKPGDGEHFKAEYDQKSGDGQIIIKDSYILGFKHIPKLKWYGFFDFMERISVKLLIYFFRQNHPEFFEDNR